MGTRVSYPIEVKMKAIEMRLAGVPVEQVLEQVSSRNHTQLKVWMKRFREGEHQPVGKQYAFGKGPDYDSEEDRLQTENRYLKQYKQN